ncbi:MAG: amidohydrolase family protein [Thermoanaerobaculia bacterium]
MQPTGLSRWLLVVASALVGCSGPPQLASVSRIEPSPPRVLFRDTAVFDGTSLLPHHDVLVAGDRIVAVSPAGTLTAPDNETLVLGGSGRTLLPGLVDSHAHLFSAGEKGPPAPDAATTAGAFLFAGVTTVLVAAGSDEAGRLRRQTQEDDSPIVPHLYTAGPGLAAPGGHPIPLLRATLPWPVRWFATRGIPTATDGSEARAQVGRIIDATRPDFVKIVYDDLPPGSPHMSREALAGAVAEADARGIRPIVHANLPQDARDAVDAGAALLMHVPQRGLLTDDDVAHIAAASVPVVTTVRLLSASYDLARHGPIPLERRMYDPEMLQPWIDQPKWELPGFSEEIDEIHDQVAADTAANFRRLLAGGVQLFVGTDSGVHGVFPGASLHRELRLLVELGMPPPDALRAATSAPAAFLDPQGTFGRIAAGQRADLILVRGDPTADIDTLAEIEEVFVAGVRLRRHPL